MRALVLKTLLKSLSIAVAAAIVWSASVSAADDDRTLVKAAARHDVKAIRALVRQGPRLVNARQPDGASALHWAAVWDDVEMADLLMRSGADVHATNDFGVTPLALACENGSFAMAERLVRAGASVNAALATGETPLMTASRIGREQQFDDLLVPNS